MPSDFFAEYKRLLDTTWLKVTRELSRHPDHDADLPEDLRSAISRLINSKTKSYRYVLPTQVLAKVVDPSLDSRCLQVSRNKKGDFDARSLSTKVIVPFDGENHNVLGGAPEPYVNNPLRVPEVSAEYRPQQKDKSGWDDLMLVLGQVDASDDPPWSVAFLSKSSSRSTVD